MSLILNGDTGVQFNDASLQGAAASPYVLKNRIINGAMVIDQRNAGASVSATTSSWSVDRWQAYASQTSKYTIQQSSTVPSGFNTSVLVTSSSAYSVTSTDIFFLRQIIEGYNIADLGFGTAGAKTFTLSFWVRSSLTGTFGGSLTNDSNRAYPFTYTISSANTWEQKTITLTADTSGTWGSTNTAGLAVIFSLGAGSTREGTAGAWTGTNYYGATGETSVVGTNGATFYITGVQLEIGTSATPFERRLYNQELANCQRYYYQITGNATQANSYIGPAIAYGATTGLAWINLPVVARTNAPSSFVSNQVTAFSNALISVSSFAIGAINTGWSSQNNAAFTFTATGMSTTQPYFFALNSSSTAYIGFSWEL